MALAVGIDAGGTKTVGLLADQTGRVLAEARSGGANLQTHGELAVEKAFDEVLEGLGGRREVGSVCVGIAGVDRPRDEAVIRDILRRLGHRDSVRVVNDAVIALVAGARGLRGIVILTGTGAIVYGADGEGRAVRAGGYGYLLADEGSGYWLGQQVLRAVVRGADGRGPRTSLQEALFGSLRVRSVGELVPIVYEQELPRHRIAALAGLAEQAAASGDGVAGEILRQAAEELGLAARAVAREIGFEEPFPVVLAGGVFKACPALVALVERALQIPAARPRLLDVEPAHGAVALALESLRTSSPPGA